MSGSAGERVELRTMSRAARRAVSAWSVCAPPAGSGDDEVDDAERQLLCRGHAHRHGGARGSIGAAPQDRGAALGRDDAVDRVLERDDDVADGDRERPAGAALAGDHGDDRRAQARS